jgi:hypothetical protein
MDVGPPLVAHRKPPVASQQRQRTLYHPPVPPQPLARVNPAASDPSLYAPLPQRLAASGEVVALVSMQLLRALPRPAGTVTGSLDRRNRDGSESHDSFRRQVFRLPLFGLVADLTGSYDASWLTLAGWVAIGTPLILLVREPQEGGEQPSKG